MKILREDGNGDRPERLGEKPRAGMDVGALLGLERERKGGKDGGRDGALKREGGGRTGSTLCRAQSSSVWRRRIN